MTTFSRLNGSVTPERLTTARTASSTVVNRRLHLAHERRRRMTWPSSTSRESTTRESEWRQNGQRIPVHPSWHSDAAARPPGDHLVDGRWTTCPNLWTNYSDVTTRCWGRRYA